MENARALSDRRVSAAACRAVYDRAPPEPATMPRWAVLVGGSLGAAVLGLMLGAALAI